MKIINSTQLRELYDQPNERAKGKQLDELDKHAANFINNSPFLILSTIDNNSGMDSSPRGGEPGFVKILNAQEIVIPDSKGNNRVDSLTNITETGRVGMLFLIPGMDETLRLNGSAYISTDNEFLDLFPSKTHPPKTCIVIKIEEVFLHCAKALIRSKLWDTSSQINRSEMPTMGQMLKDQLSSNQEVETQEQMIKRYKNDL